VSCTCFDCGVETIPAAGEQEYYSVWDEIWAAAWLPSSAAQQLILFDVGEPAVVAHPGATPRGTFLCIGCLEQRIGRRLTRADFSDAPINALDAEVWSFRTARLHDRLSS
jgi:hypothetical protein